MVWVVWSENDTQDMHAMIKFCINFDDVSPWHSSVFSKPLQSLGWEEPYSLSDPPYINFMPLPEEITLILSSSFFFTFFFSSLSAAITMIINNWEKKTQRLNILILLYFWVQNIENIGTNKKTTTIYLKDLQCGNQKAWKTDSMRNNSVLQETNIETEISETPYLRSKVTSISSNKLQCWQEIFMGITSSNDEAPLFTESCYLWDSK